MKKVNTNLIKKMERFAEVTVNSLKLGKMVRAKRCFALAEDLFQKGNAEVKNAISNVYLYSVSHYLELNHFTMKQFLPVELHKEYVKQINTSGV
ncbi:MULTISPECIES: DUF7674 family protein [Flavobacterium]|uniref:DUF7674 domain-containing protein n=1 Tax=Flavobacterium hankyongi TaxID=1176532 RepID=A0ABP8ZJV3_9FLAO|nr:hypothetical protein [Flavobacterium sp. N1846]